MTSNRAPGFSLAELVITVVILGVALIPIYSAFISSSRSVSSSRLAYMAMQVARETMEELRQVPVEKLKDLKDLDNALGGKSIFAFTAQMRAAKNQGDDPNKVNDTALKYPLEYNRIRRKIEITPVDSGVKKEELEKAHLIKVVLDVSWEETGGKSEKQRPGLMRYVTYLGNHSVDPEVRE